MIACLASIALGISAFTSLFVHGEAEPVSAEPADPARTVSLDVSGLLNARVVTTVSKDALVTWNKGVDGTWSGLATRRAADWMGSASRVALPDDGVFLANSLHPRVALHFSNDDATGSQVRYTERNVAERYSIEMGGKPFQEVFLFFMSAFGTSEITLELAYADNSTEVRRLAIPDWASTPAESADQFLLAKDLAKWGPKNTELEKDHHALMGYRVTPDRLKPLSRISVQKPASKTSLTFWGATGSRSGPVPRWIAGNAASIAYEGRTVVEADGRVRCGYPGIVCRVRFKGTFLHLRARTTSAELYADVRLDGGEWRFLQIPKGEHDVVLASALAPGDHQVELLKRVETSVGILEVESMTTDGEFLPAPVPPTRRLLFLGDSFTAGQATTVEDGGPPMAPSKALRQNARLAYGRLLADRFQAQCHFVVYAGRGVMRDWQGVRSVRCAPEYYENAIPEDVTTRWDPKRYEPDAVGVCLGNNDFGDGVPDQTEYLRIYTEFIRKLRRDAPHAVIFLIPSPSLVDEPDRVPLRTVQKAYLTEVVRRLGDARVLMAPISSYPGVPGDWHPSGTAHRKVADELEPVFRKALGW